MKAIRSRRSIRHYTDQAIPAEMERQLLDAAMCAPSAGNERPWHFVVIRDREILDSIPNYHPYANMMPEANMAILVCGEQGLEKHDGYWVQDCAAATQNILLEAEDIGLGAVWLGVYPTEDRVTALRSLLGIPEEVTPFALVALGFPAERKPVPERYDEARIHQNRW